MPKRYKGTEHPEDSVTHPLCQPESEEKASTSQDYVCIPMEPIESNVTAAEVHYADTPNTNSETLTKNRNEEKQQDEFIPAPGPSTDDANKIKPNTSSNINDQQRQLKSIPIENEVMNKETVIRRLNTLLLGAIQNHNNEEVKRLLQNGANPNARCIKTSASACHVAAYADNSEALSMLKDLGARMHPRDEQGHTPLHYAAWSGSNKAIAVLLDFPDDLQKKMDLEMTPKIEINVKRLRPHIYTDTINVVSYNEKPPANYIVPRNWLTTNKSPQPEFQFTPDWFTRSWTPLHVASYKIQHSTAQLLLAAGANPNTETVEGNTPLDVVGVVSYWSSGELSEDHYVRTIQVLRKYGGRINKPYFDTAIRTAVEMCSGTAIHELITAGAPVTILRKDSTLLHECVKKSCTGPLQVLINFTQPGKTCTYVDVPDKNGHTVLHAAILASWLPGVCIALDASADVIREDNRGYTAIHLAARQGNIDILKKMLSYAKSILAERDFQNALDLENGHVETPLLCAIRSGNKDCVEEILDNGGKSTITFYNYGPENEVDPHLSLFFKMYISSLSTTEREEFNMIIHATAMIGNEDILQFLLNRYIDLRKLLFYRCRFLMNMIPVELAAMYNQLVTYKYLLQVTVTDKYFARIPFDPSKLLDLIACLNREEMYNELVKHIPDVVSIAIRKGHYPLHNAIKNSNKNIILHMIDNGADLSQLDNLDDTAIDLIFEHISKPKEFIENVFDCYIKTNNNPIEKRGCEVTIDYRVLIPPDASKNPKGDMRVMKSLLANENSKDVRKLLVHPLIESFLYLKWKTLSTYFYILVGFYTLFVILLSWNIVSVIYNKDENGSIPVPPSWIIYIILGFIITQEFLYFDLELKAWTLRIFSVEFWVKSVTYVLAVVSTQVITTNCTDTEWWRHVATLTLVLAWSNIMILLSKTPMSGYYMQMFWKVSAKIGKILFTFLFLIIMFAFSFMIQFHSKAPFHGPISAILKTIVMMTSEFEYDSNFNEEKATSMFACVVMRTVFVVFLILTAIVLMNLMIGVAVQDVQYLVEYGKSKRLAKQVGFLNKLEVSRGKKSFYHKFRLYRWINYKKVSQQIKIKAVNDGKCCFEKRIREAILNKAQEQLDNTKKEAESNESESKLENISQAITLQKQKITDVESKLDIIQTAIIKEQNQNESNSQKILQTITMIEQSLRNKSKLDDFLQVMTMKEQNKLRKNRNWTRSHKLLRLKNK